MARTLASIVSGVEAAAFVVHSHGVELAMGAALTLGADLDRIRAKSLAKLKAVATLRTFIVIDGHFSLLKRRY